MWVSYTATHFKNVFQHAFNQGQFQMAGVVRVAEADDRSLIVLVDWAGFEVDERTWKPLKEIFEAAPEFLAKELRNCLLYTSPSPRDRG